ncbi:beta-lactamase class D [Devosia sp. YR412]|uniref:class D beta-lactamase n=1 Tax=Devosia sp. YR412 TaxID=1881030 RepID=UPI0008D306BF|nr:class D beta-lactamase [Devosia sp. YR412]SEQ62278.1 beta-lactamase class D [Devosia sp. YR412]
MLRLLTIFAMLTFAAPARAETLCTLIADAGAGQLLHEQGAGCDTPTTPASTYKIPLAVMGFDSGMLTDAHNPALPFVEGYADWGGAEWRQTTDPLAWMDYSVVWYSQAIARTLGAEQLTRYATAFDYGNADFSGDPGNDNGLERSWISSSLKLTPRQQLAFMARLVNRQLPVSAHAMETTLSILQRREVDGWQVLGKTGSAFPRQADGNFDRARGWGWYVGTASKGDQTLVFVRLDQDEARNVVSGGLRARDAFLLELPRLIGR